MDKAMEYLCLGRKAGLVATGETGCGSAAEAGRVRLMLLAADASDNARRRAEGFLRGRRAPLAKVPWTKEELSERMGKAGCAMLCFTDLGLASRFAEAMAGTDPAWRETAELLAARDERARRRKAAPRKHAPAAGKGGKNNGS